MEWYVLNFGSGTFDLQDWALGQTDRMMKSVPPLIFHPLTMVRRAVAIFLAPLLFVPAMRLIITDLQASWNDCQHTASIPLFAGFRDRYYVPFPVKEIPLGSLAVETATGDREGEDCNMISELLGDEGRRKMRLVQLLVSLGRLQKCSIGELSQSNESDMMPACAAQIHQTKLTHCLQLLQTSGELAVSVPPDGYGACPSPDQPSPKSNAMPIYQSCHRDREAVPLLRRT